VQAFTYTARDSKSGERVIADIEAENETSAAKILIERGLTPLEILPKGERTNLSVTGHGHKVKSKDRVIFSRQLSTLINAGLP
jgi:type IV pilus assembly protein PilC